MKFRLTCLAMAVVAAVTFVSAEQNDVARTQMEAARKKEVVDGDLKAAIQQYQAIAETYKGDHAVAADALIRLAACYEKLGDTESKRIYERLVRDYGDQKDAVAIARARLGGAAPVALARGDRPAWTGPKVDLFGQVSPDGRYITYVDWGGDENLMLHDLATNTDRALTPTPAVRFSQFAEFSAISKDGKQVAYGWSTDGGKYELRILPFPTAAGQPRKVFQSDDVRSIAPADWSFDGKSIAVNIQRPDGTGQIGIVSVVNGALRVLKSVDWRGANKIAFSPDGRYIAYDLAVGDSDTERHIYAMATDGSGETVIVSDRSRNVVMAWTPDGHDVLFASDRTGSTSLWRQKVASGRTQGGPTLLKRDIGSSISLGLTNSGAMYVYKAPSANFVEIATLDLDAATIRASQDKTFQRFVGSGGVPSWSVDGRDLVYKSCDGAASLRKVCAVNIASIDSGEVRLLWPKLSYLGGLHMAADGRGLVAIGRDIKGRPGIYHVDDRTAEISPLLVPRPGAIEQWSPNGKTLYFRRAGSLVARDVSTGAERELFKQDDTRTLSASLQVSPDGRFIASVSGPVLYLVPTAGGAVKEVLHAKTGEAFDGYRAQWTPDGRSLVLPKQINDETIELWIVPMFGNGAPRKIDVDTSNWVLPGGGFAIHPSGRQIAYVGMAGKQGAEVWALENFLP